MRYEIQHRMEQARRSRRDATVILGLGALIIVGMIVVALITAGPQPRLAAYGCNPDNGGVGVVYADEEDHFPASCVHVVAL